MKLQVALDTLTLEDCLTLLEETKGSVDIAEVGTPFIIEEGMRPVREFKKHFPDIEVLAETPAVAFSSVLRFHLRLE